MIHPIEFRYGSARMRRIFEREARLDYMLRVEAAVAHAHATLGHIPEEAAREIGEKANTKVVTLARWDELEAQTHHDIVSLAEALSEKCRYGGYVHLGVTSNDINDTATALQLADAVDIALDNLGVLAEKLKKLALEKIDLVCIGRTHGQHAIPTTYGMKCALFYSEVKRDITRLKAARGNIAGKISGAVGTFASLENGLELQDLVSKSLEVPMADITNQVVQRDNHAELICTLALIASTLDKIATEIRNLSRSEIAEVSEGFGEKQVGSSTMPHKKNPLNAERVCGLARIIYSHVYPSLLNNVLWHERDLTNSSAERVIFPECFILVDEMLISMISLLDGLVFYPENIEANLRRNKNVMAESVMMALARKGMDRQVAHRLLRSLSKEGDFEKNILSNREVRRYLSEREIASALDPTAYIGEARRIVKKVCR